jgi:hypothetical protein
MLKIYIQLSNIKTKLTAAFRSVAKEPNVSNHITVSVKVMVFWWNIFRKDETSFEVWNEADHSTKVGRSSLYLLNLKILIKSNNEFISFNFKFFIKWNMLKSVRILAKFCQIF